MSKSADLKILKWNAPPTADDLKFEALPKLCLFRIVEFLEIKETVHLPLVSRKVRYGLMGAPLRLDWLMKVITYPLIELIYADSKFNVDGKIIIGKQWEVSGLISGLSELNTVFTRVDPVKLMQLGVANRIFKDLSPASSCTNLTKVEFHGCDEVTDLSPLISLSKLKVLMLLMMGKLSDLSPLKRMKSVTDLYISLCSGVTSIEALKDMPQLDKLSITDCHIDQPSYEIAFPHLVNLRLLELKGATGSVKNLNFLPKTDTLLHLVITGGGMPLPLPIHINDINGVANCSRRLKTLALMNFWGCETGIKKAVENASDLISVKLDGMRMLDDVSALRGKPKLTEISLSECSAITGLASIFENVTRSKDTADDTTGGFIRAIFLSKCHQLDENDAASILRFCPKLLLLDVNGCSPLFLGKIAVSDKFIVSKNGKGALDAYFNRAVDSGKKMIEAAEMLEMLLTTDVSHANNALPNTQQSMQTLSVINDLCKTRNIAAGFWSSKVCVDFSFNVIMHPKNYEKNFLTMVMELFANVQRSECQACNMYFKDMNRMYALVNLMKMEFVENGRLLQTGVFSLDMLSLLFENMKKSLFERFPQQIGRTTLDANEILKAIRTTATLLCNDSTFLGYIMRMLKLEYPEKDQSSNALRFCSGLSSVIALHNKITGLAGSNSLQTLPIPNIFLTEGLQLMLQSIQLKAMSQPSKHSSITWLLSLIQEEPEVTFSILLSKYNEFQTLLIDFLLLGFAMLAKRQDGDIPIAVIGEVLKTGANILVALSPQIRDTLLKSARGEEGNAIALMIGLIQSLTTWIQTLINSEDTQIDSREYDKNLYIPVLKEAVSITELFIKSLAQFIDHPSKAETLMDISEKSAVVIATLLHCATDELSLYIPTSNLIFFCMQHSPRFKEKLLFLYTNSDIAVAMKLFMNPPLRKIKRVAKNLEQQRLGLNLLLKLCENELFATKFLEYRAPLRDDFISQFHRFVFQAEATAGRVDFDGLKTAALIVSKLLRPPNGDESEHAQRIQTVLKLYVAPLVDHIDDLGQPAKIQELIKKEENARDSDEQALLAYEKRRGYQSSNIFGLFGLGALFGEDRDNQIEVIEPRSPNAVAEELYGASKSPAKSTQNEKRGPMIVNGNVNKIETFGYITSLDKSKFTSKLVDTYWRWLHADNWLFRITDFYTTLIGKTDGDAFSALGLLTSNKIAMLLGFVHQADRAIIDINRDTSLSTELRQALTARKYLMVGSIFNLIASVFKQFLSPSGRALFSGKMTEHKHEEDLKDLPPPPPPPTGIAALFSFLGPGAMQAHVRAQLEAKDRFEEAFVRDVHAKNRFKTHAEKLAERLVSDSPDSDTKPVSNTLQVVSVLSNVEKDRLVQFWNLVAANININRFISSVCKIILNCRMQKPIIASFFLLNVMSDVGTTMPSAIQVLSIALAENPVLINSALENFAELENSNGTGFEFFKAYSRLNYVKACETILMPLFDQLNPADKTATLTILGFFTKVLNEEIVPRKDVKTRILIGKQLGRLLYKAKIDSSLAMGSMICISCLIDGSLEIFLAMAEAESQDQFSQFLCKHLNEKESPLSIFAVAILRKVLANSNPESLMFAFGEKMINGGMLEGLDSWKDRKLAVNGLQSGVLALVIAVESGHSDAILPYRATIVPIMLEALLEDPNPRYSKILCALEPALGTQHEKDDPSILNIFKGYPALEISLRREKDIQADQADRGDFMLRRLRGLPNQLSFTRKYVVNFGKTLSTVAIGQETSPKNLDNMQAYFEVQVRSIGKDPWLKVGVVGLFEEGILKGNLLSSIDKDPNAAGVDVSTNTNDDSIFGILHDIGKRQLVISTNDANKIVINLESQQKDWFPAVGGRNVAVQINIGQGPFRHFPQNINCCSFKDLLANN